MAQRRPIADRSASGNIIVKKEDVDILIDWFWFGHEP